MALEYLALVRKYQHVVPEVTRYVKPHLFRMLFAGLSLHPEKRALLGAQGHELDSLEAFCRDLAALDWEKAVAEQAAPSGGPLPEVVEAPPSTRGILRASADPLLAASWYMRHHQAVQGPGTGDDAGSRAAAADSAAAAAQQSGGRSAGSRLEALKGALPVLASDDMLITLYFTTLAGACGGAGALVTAEVALELASKAYEANCMDPNAPAGQGKSLKRRLFKAEKAKEKMLRKMRRLEEEASREAGGAAAAEEGVQEPGSDEQEEQERSAHAVVDTGGEGCCGDGDGGDGGGAKDERGAC